MNLRAHPDIVGIRPMGLNCTLPVVSLYADDTSVVASSFAAIQAVFSVYQLFERGSGSRLNLGKCEGLWLGPWRFSTAAPPVDISWSHSKIKVLGVFIGHGDLAGDNWCPCVDAVARCLNSWRSSSLSFTERALVVNALALSPVWYVASLIHMPAWVLRSLTN